ncbi:hypothetical protein HH740_002291 [Escherichia coli]|nr:hypothetical protein [Escherichia coli]EFI3892387.1 hypothetical protein [Escherichia coli]EFI3923785.1 hypothetical protein [Escherichia coli]EFI4314012.1 hypothetical protein [Escherichia coli]EFI4340357.1 hypothetical protein [Escherichia coli]
MLWRVWQTISAVVTDAFSPEGFLFVVNGRLVGGDTCQSFAYVLMIIYLLGL